MVYQINTNDLLDHFVQTKLTAFCYTVDFEHAEMSKILSWSKLYGLVTVVRFWLSYMGVPYVRVPDSERQTF